MSFRPIIDALLVVGITVAIVEPMSMSLGFVERSDPGVAEPGHARLYVDSGDHRLKVSADGNAFVDMLTESDTSSFQQTSAKGQANGYAGLGATALVPMSQLATGTPTGSKFIRDDGTLQSIPGALTDGDKGDITVSASGATWTIDNLAVTAAKIANATLTDVQVAAANKDGVAGTASMRTLGTGASQAAAGNDSRFTDDRTASGLRTATTVVGISSAAAPTAGQVLTATSDTAATWQTPTGSMTTLKKTANQTVNGTGYVDITGLTFPVSANTNYAFKFYVVFQSAQTATGFRFAMNGPAGTSPSYFMTYQTVANSTTVGVATWLQGHWVTYDAMAVTTTSPAAAVDLVVMIEGRVSVGATPGTMAVRVASEAANNDLTVRAGSWGLLF